MAQFFNLVNPTSGVGDELREMLAEREAKRRQDMLDKIMQQQETRADAASRRADQQMTLQQEQFQAGLADKIYEDLLPHDIQTPETAALLRKYGRGGGLRDSGTGIAPEARLTPDQVDVGTPTRSGDVSGNLTPEQMAELDKALTGSMADLKSTPTKTGVAPGVVFSERGGPKWAASRQAAQERAEQAKAAAQSREDIAEANREAAKERAEADRAMRLTIAQLAASTSASNRALADELKQVQINTAKDKLEETKNARDRQKTTLESHAKETLGVIDDLLTPTQDGRGFALKPGVAGIVGMTTGQRWIPGSPEANAEAAIDRLQGRLVVDLIGEMKSQSRTGATGFGALSERELSVLENAASKLSNRWQSDESYRRELVRVKQMVEKILQPPTGASPATPPQGAPGTPQTRTIRNPKTGETRTQTSTDGVNWK